MAIPTLAMQSIASILSGQYISRRKRYGEVIWAGFALWTLYVGRNPLPSLNISHI